MAERSRLPRPLFRRDMRWDPYCDWTLPSRTFDYEMDLPPFLEPRDLSWIEWARRRLATSSWPGYMPPPAVSPFAMQTPSHSPHRELPVGVSEVRTGPDSWRISLDVNCFSPQEISIKTNGGYLEIAGKQEGREDMYGFVSRCFSRKYKLPAGVDLRHIRSSLSPDGVLSVEAPLPVLAPEVPVEIIIPVQVEKKPQTQRGGEVSPQIQRGEEGEQGQQERVRTTEIAPPAGDQQEGKGKQVALEEFQTSTAERVWASAGEESEERRLRKEEDGKEGEHDEVSAKTEMETAVLGNLGSMEQNGEALSETVQEDVLAEGSDQPSEPQTSGQDVLQENKVETHLDTKWLSRDTKWMLRSTKWPSQY
ncbi:hypothetical protein MATL_G00085680 [Megalops atlanticus]|uniref:SHSP domain-containing protein n=1 Tax=Megalops atlanticus TaxID=7932 RepID=A0A9D3Q806_MEGAT|nr:hypothetical protein MATL_G00085680 [Megalops atlanticus]